MMLRRGRSVKSYIWDNVHLDGVSYTRTYGGEAILVVISRNISLYSGSETAIDIMEQVHKANTDIEQAAKRISQQLKEFKPKVGDVKIKTHKNSLYLSSVISMYDIKEEVEQLADTLDAMGYPEF